VGDGTVPTVLQADGVVALIRNGDVRVGLDGSGAIVLQQWIGDEWYTRGSLNLSAGFRLRSNGAEVTGIVVDTIGEQTTEVQAADTASLWCAGAVFGVADQEGASIALNRTRPELASSDAQTLTYDRHHVLSGTATASALPAATADDVGRCLAISNRTAGALTISRAGSDTIEGATSFDVEAGAKAVFEVVGSGDWAVWG
jgi:hypothetical protein